MGEQSNMHDSILFLHDISLLLSSESELNDKFEQALTKLVEALGCHAASIFLVDEQTGKLVETVSVGARVELIESIDFDMGQGFSAWVAKQGRAVLIPRLSSHKDFSSFVSAPLKLNSTLVGVINLGHRQPDAFTEEDLKLVEIITEELALLINRVKYERKLVEANNALKEAQVEIRKQQARIIEMEKYHVMAQMAASINHEINNPLTTILGNAELIIMMNPEIGEEIRVKLEKIVTEARRISTITEKLRNMKRVVVEDYLAKTRETMIDIDSSTGEQENNS